LKLAILSDIHGNLPALEKSVHTAGAVDGFIILGDVVNYGPWGNECVQYIESLRNCIKLRGNHEDYFIEGHFGCDNQLGREFFNACYPKFIETKSIAEYQTSHLFNGKICKHTIGGMHIYTDSIIQLDNDYIIGHSHHQYLIRNNGFTLINPGSVGQNRKYINEINYMIFDTKQKQSSLRAIPYDVDSVINKMCEMDYPSICVDYYRNKPRK